MEMPSVAQPEESAMGLPRAVLQGGRIDLPQSRKVLEVKEYRPGGSRLGATELWAQRYLLGEEVLVSWCVDHDRQPKGSLPEQLLDLQSREREI